jgi:hypothetical protein
MASPRRAAPRRAAAQVSKSHDHQIEAERVRARQENDPHAAQRARWTRRLERSSSRNVHRCAVLSAEPRAGQYKYTEIELAAAHQHGMLDELMPEPDSKERRHVSTS